MTAQGFQLMLNGMTTFDERTNAADVARLTQGQVRALQQIGEERTATVRDYPFHPVRSQVLGEKLTCGSEISIQIWIPRSA